MVGSQIANCRCDSNKNAHTSDLQFYKGQFFIILNMRKTLVSAASCKCSKDTVGKLSSLYKRTL